MKVSKRRASFGDRYVRDVEALHLAGDLATERRDGSKRVMRVMPDLPARMFAQASATRVADRRDDAQAGDDYAAS